MISLRLLSLIVLVTASACVSASVREAPSCTLVIRAPPNGHFAQINELEVALTCRPDYGDTHVELHRELQDRPGQDWRGRVLKGVKQVEHSRKCGALSEQCLLSFCDSKGPIMFEQPKIQGVRWPACGRNCTTCAVGFGGTSRAKIINGTFEHNDIGSVLRVEGNSSVLITGTSIMNGIGGISAEDRSELTLINSTLASLDSDRSGACLSASGNARVTLVNTSLSNCRSRRSGGAISAVDKVLITMTQGSSITGCRAEQGGGGLSLTDRAAMLASDSSFTDNTADEPTSGNCGGGGAAMLSINATLTAVNCIWVRNRARMYGGVLTAERPKKEKVPSVKFTNCTFQGNVAGLGGAIRINGATVLVVKDSRFISNHAGMPAGPAGIAGAIAARGTSNVELVNVDIYNNTADSMGGALGVWDSARMLVDNSRLWGNTAHDRRSTQLQHGGAAVVWNTGVLILSRSGLWNNTGGHMGGAVSAWHECHVFINACNLSGNVASCRGGAVRVADRAIVELHDSNLSGNMASCRDGAVRVADSATVVLRDSILAGNQPCPQDKSPGKTDTPCSCGGAICVGDTSDVRPNMSGSSRVVLDNTIVAGNTAGRGGGLCAEPPADTSRAMPDHDCVVVKVQVRDNTTFKDNNGTNGSDVYALAAAVLSMPYGSSNLNTSSSTVFWKVSCDMGYYLDPTRGTCTRCAAPSYILDEGASRNVIKCNRCSEAAECFGGAVLVAKSKFFHTHGTPGARGEARGSVPTCRLDNLTRCPNPEACKHKEEEMVRAHPFTNTNGSYAMSSSAWQTYEHQLCSAPAYTGILCTVCNSSGGFGQTDIFTCDACVGVVDHTRGGSPDGHTIGVLWAGYALGFTFYLMVVLVLHLRENPPPLSSSVAVVDAVTPNTATQHHTQGSCGRQADVTVDLDDGRNTINNSHATLPSHECNKEESQPLVDDAKLHFAELFKALALYLQYLAGVILKLPVTWPVVISKPAHRIAQAWARLMGSGASIDCLLIASHWKGLGTPSYTPTPQQAGLKALISMLAPFATFLAIVVVILLWWGFLRHIVYSRVRTAAKLGKDSSNRHNYGCFPTIDRVLSWALGPEQLARLSHQQNYVRPDFGSYMVDRVIPMLLITAFFWYPSIARVALGMFGCMSVCGDSRWVMDMRFPCPRPDPTTPPGHWAYGVGLPAAVITAFIPLFVLCWLWSHKTMTNDAAFRSKYAFMYSDYNFKAEELSLSFGRALAKLWQSICGLCKTTTRAHGAATPAEAQESNLGVWGCLTELCLVLRHHIILVWDVAIHCTTLLLMICSVYGAYGMHEYYQVLLMCAVFGVYMFAVMLIRPFSGINQVLQSMIAAVLLATSLGVLVFIDPDGLDTRQQKIVGGISTGVGVVLLVLNGLVAIPLVLLLVGKMFWGMGKAATSFARLSSSEAAHEA